MNTLEIDQNLQRRLTAIGNAFDAAPTFAATPRMETPPRRNRGRWIRSLALVVVTGAAAGGGLLVAGPKADDPIVGVIPKNVKAAEIQSISSQSATTPDQQHLTYLVTVEGVDALVSTGIGTTQRKMNGEDQRQIDGASVFTKETEFPKGQLRTSIRWNNSDGTSVYVEIKRERSGLDPIIDRLVRFVIRTNAGGDPLDLGVTTVGSWKEAGVSTSLKLGGEKTVVVGADGTTRIKTSPQRYIVSSWSDMPAELLTRVFEISGIPPSGNRFRFGSFIVTASPSVDSVRALHRSEMRRLVRQVDKRQAAKIAPIAWTKMGHGLETGSYSESLCVRSKTDVACGPYAVNRLVGSTWVSTGDPVHSTATVSGRTISGFIPAGSTGLTIYVLPPDAVTMEVTYRNSDGTSLIVTVRRPEF